MMRYFQLFLCLVSCGVIFADSPTTPQATDFSQKSKPATIKVLIERRAPQALIEVKGRHHIYNPLDGVSISTGIMSKRDKVTAEEYGIKWGEKFPGLHQIRIVPTDSQSSILINGIQYKGCVEVYAADGKVNIVNEVDVESFLKSTLTAQFLEAIDNEVMSAVAIVARTNAYYQIAKNRAAFWHVEAEDAHYLGNAAIQQKAYIDRAIESTRHAVLTMQNKPFAAAWTNNSAGRTADYASIFRKAIISPSGVQTPIAAKDREQHHWMFTYPKSALAKTANLSNITAVDLYVAHNSDKVYAVKLSNGTEANDVDFFTLQKVLGPERLKSTDFTVALKGDQLVFNGYGEGPGVGLCLYSAAALAHKGENASQILSHFFPDTQLEKMKNVPSQN